MTKKQEHWLNQVQMAESLGITVNAFARWKVEPVARIGKTSTTMSAASSTTV